MWSEAMKMTVLTLQEIDITLLIQVNAAHLRNTAYLLWSRATKVSDNNWSIAKLRFDFWFPKFNLNAQGLDEVGEVPGSKTFRNIHEFLCHTNNGKRHKDHSDFLVCEYYHIRKISERRYSAHRLKFAEFPQFFRRETLNQFNKWEHLAFLVIIQKMDLYRCLNVLFCSCPVTALNFLFWS